MSRGAPFATISLGQKWQSKAQLKLFPSVAKLMGSTPDLPEQTITSKTS
jgi:hypothetical protein